MAVAARFQKRGRIPASAPRPHFNNNRSLVRQSFHLCVPRNCRLDPKPLPRLAASSIRPLTATLALCLPSSSGTRKVDPAADSRLITACFFVCGTILLPATTYVYEPSPNTSLPRPPLAIESRLPQGTPAGANINHATSRDVLRDARTLHITGIGATGRTGRRHPQD